MWDSEPFSILICGAKGGAPWRQVPGEDQHHAYGAYAAARPLAGAQNLRPADLALIGQSKWGANPFETCLLQGRTPIVSADCQGKWP